MFEVEIDGENVKAEVSFQTALIYEAEFQRDLIKDFFGVSTTDPTVETDEGENVVRVDFTKTNWTSTMKLLWAAIKTADPHAPSFTAWMKDTKGVNMWLLNEQLGAEVADCFFRS